MPPQCITLHVGQAGAQMGNHCWELFNQEHEISKEGTFLDENAIVDDNLKMFYQEIQERRFSPRTIFVDLEPSVLDEIRAGPYRKLYSPDQLISSKEDASNNYARGYFSIGKEVLPKVMDRIRLMSDQCNSLQGFMVFHSYGGGTGSGLASLLLNELKREFHKKTHLEVVVLPSQHISTGMTEPYNSVLATYDTHDKVDCAFVYTNEALYKLCGTYLGCTNPTYNNLNRVIAQAVSSITTSMRFDGTLNVDLNEFHTNLVPYPRLHYTLVSYSPLLPSYKRDHESLTIPDLTKSCFESTNQSIDCEIENGKYMACCLLYRGDITPKDINTSIQQLKADKGIKFVNWCQTGFKIGINSQRPQVIPNSEIVDSPRSVCMLSNTTAVREVFQKINRKFDVMFRKRAFVHWYLTEGLEEQQLVDARVNTAILEKDYIEIHEDNYDDKDL